MRRIQSQFQCRLVWAGVLALLLPCVQAVAQFNGSLSGTVTDTSGAVIPGAKVTLKSSSTQVTREATSGGEGSYQFNSLPPGDYGVTVTAENFKTASFDNVTVAAESPRNLDAHLSTGGASETVTVNATDVPALETSDASVGGSISNEAIERLPAFGRDPYELLRATPGVTSDAARSGSGVSIFLPNGNGGKGQSNYGLFQTENQIQLSAAGQRVTSNTYLIDGVSVDSLEFGGTAVVTPSPEAVDQISTSSTSFNAEDGRNVGAQIKVTTKSGSNQFHGSAFFQYDEPGLNSFNRYGGPNGASPIRVSNKNREYAGSIGGPVLRDKLFFFYSMEGFRSNNSTSSTLYVETPELRQLLAKARPTGVSAAVFAAPGTAPRVVKVLGQSCATAGFTNRPCQAVGDGLDIGSPAGALGTYVKIGSSGGGLDGIPDIQQVQASIPTKLSGRQYNGRADWYVTPSNQLAASVFITTFNNASSDGSTGGRANTDLPFKPVNTAGTLLFIHTFSPTLINEARANFTRFSADQVGDAASTNFGIPRVEVQNLGSANRIEVGAAQGGTSPGTFVENTYEARDTIIKTLGAHTIRTGVVYRSEQDNSNLIGGNRPDYVFDGLWNLFNDAPIFEGITANPSTGGPAITQRYFRDRYIALFLQHDWKVTPNFTLNTGVRWEFFSPLHNKGLRTNTPQLGPAGSELIQSRLVPASDLYKADYNNVAPKLGFAWSPGTQGKFVVRGGFGVSFDRVDNNLFSAQRENGPGFFSYGICCGTSTSDFSTPFKGGLISYKLGTSKSVNSYPANPALAVGVNPITGTPNAFGGNSPQVETYGSRRNTPNAYLYSYALDMQYLLPFQIVADAGYQGSSGHKFLRLVNQNFLYANQTGACLTGGTCTVGVNQTPFNAYFIPTPDVYTSFNGLNLSLSQRYRHGLQLSLGYTYSKSLDQGSNEGPSFVSNQTNPAFPVTEYGPSDFDNRHRVTAYGLWDLPKVKVGNALVQAVANGWQVNGIYTYHTGFPWTPVTFAINGQGLVQNTATPSPVRPTQYAGGAGSSCSNPAFRNGTNFSRGGASYFNIKTPGQPGIGRNSFVGPCYQDTDMSVAKVTALTAGDRPLKLKIQANFFNVLNQLTLQPIAFGSGQATIENNQFGRSAGGNAGRVVEFQARLEF